MNGIQEIERFQGCLLGGALGDALGWPVKFRYREEILQDSAPDGILEPRVGTSGYVEVSDDTQLALFSAEGLLLARAQGGHELTACTRHLHRAYLRWLHTQGESPAFMDHGCLEEGWLIDLPPLHARRAPGATCLAALASGRAGTPEHPLNNSRGYGGVVRAAPAGLFIASLQPKRGEGAHLSGAFELGCRLAAITHGHPSGYLPAGVLAATVCRLVQGESLADAVKEALELLRGRPDHEETLLSLEFALALVSWRTPAHYAIQLMGKGCLGHEALAISLYCAMTAGSDFARGVRLAVNHSGDSDSTGAVTGNLLGALLGRSAIPQPWLEKLELRQTLEEMADRLAGRKPAGG
jgi:ADP-ribosylglycohydrolase